MGADQIEQLNSACFMGSVDKVKQLLAEGVDVNGRSNSGATPLTSAVEMNSAPVVELLLQKGADPNLKDRKSVV